MLNALLLVGFRPHSNIMRLPYSRAVGFGIVLALHMVRRPRGFSVFDSSCLIFRGRPLGFSGMFFSGCWSPL